MINTGFILGAAAFQDIFGQECVEAVAPLGRVLGPPVTLEQVNAAPPDWLGEMEALFTGWGGPRLDEAVLARMPKLRAVFYGAGTLRFTVTDACWPRGIVFSSAAALNAVPTSEFAFGAILLSLKRCWQQAAAARAARTFTQSLPLPGGFGSTVGLASLGQIGRRVAERLRTLEVNVIAHDPFAPPALFKAMGIESCALEELFERADILSLHTPLLPETTGMVNAALLARLKPNATFINTARGGLVHEPDLIDFLRARPDVQAILDVTEPEPPPADSPFWDLPNVFLTPHIAGSLGPECRRMGRAMIEEFHRYARGEPLYYGIATPEQLARTA
jgi:phosphoglycerate dehydrogenase-like enzyme